MKTPMMTASVVTAMVGVVHGSHLLRVHITSKLATLYEQCEWEDRAVRCEDGMFCVMREEDFGWCMKEEPGEGDQCGGAETDGPWSVPCNGTDLTCVLISSQYSQCQVTESEGEGESGDEQ